jgi:hypothetical protein
MFVGSIVWRGIVYTILMALGKMLCGIWFLSSLAPTAILKRVHKSFAASKKQHIKKKLSAGTNCTGIESSSPRKKGQTEPAAGGKTDQEAEGNPQVGPVQPSRDSSSITMPQNALPEPEMPVSLYPACIIASAMIARGEIGYLISALAEGSGIFRRESSGSDEPSELFLIITWAISLCTIIGPISVGLLVRRVKGLELKRGASGRGPKNILGAWGVS